MKEWRSPIDIWRESPEGQERQQQTMKHQWEDCFGGPNECMSCGCDKSGKWGKIGPCVSHQSSPGYNNYLLEQLIQVTKEANESRISK